MWERGSEVGMDGERKGGREFREREREPAIYAEQQYTIWIIIKCMCTYIHSLSSGMVVGAVGSTGVWMSVSDTLFLNRLSFDLVAIIVVSMAPYNTHVNHLLLSVLYCLSCST